MILASPLKLKIYLHLLKVFQISITSTAHADSSVSGSVVRTVAEIEIKKQLPGTPQRANHANSLECGPTQGGVDDLAAKEEKLKLPERRNLETIATNPCVTDKI